MCWKLRAELRSCREQTAGHNALLLFVHLALTMMEGRLDNAFKDLTAKKAEVNVSQAWVDGRPDCMAIEPADAMESNRVVAESSLVAVA